MAYISVKPIKPDAKGNYSCGCVYSPFSQVWLYICPDHKRQAQRSTRERAARIRAARLAVQS